MNLFIFVLLQIDFYFQKIEYSFSSKVCWKESKMRQLMELVFMEVVILGENNSY